MVKRVYEYFEDEVIPAIYPAREADVLEKMVNLITQDTEIAKAKKAELISKNEAGENSKFLADVFLYSLTRENRKNTKQVEPNDIPLLDEVGYECPITHEKLIEEIKGVQVKKYFITQIFPGGLSDEHGAAFAAVCGKPNDLDASANLIALSESASKEYLLKPTLEEFENLHRIKEQVSKGLWLEDL